MGHLDHLYRKVPLLKLLPSCPDHIDRNGLIVSARKYRNWNLPLGGGEIEKTICLLSQRSRMHRDGREILRLKEGHLQAERCPSGMSKEINPPWVNRIFL